MICRPRALQGNLLLLFFLATSLMGVWSAYAKGPAWQRFGLIASGAALAMVIGTIGRRDQERTLASLAIGSACLAAVTSAYFVLVHDWTASDLDKFLAVRRIGLWIQSQVPSLPLLKDIHGEVAAGVLAVTLPLGAGGATRAIQVRHWLLAAFLAAILFPAAFCLVLTVSRGALLGLLLSGVVVGCLATRVRRKTWPRWGTSAFLAVAGTLLASSFWFAVTVPEAADWLGSAGALAGSAVSRVQLWREMLAVVADYPFTGSGLGSTSMIYSTYVLLLHVDFIGHAHNIFLQAAVEQGLPGMGMLVAILGWSTSALLNAYAKSQTEDQGLTVGILYLAALASLVALTIHGMVDGGLYVTKGAPALFIPISAALVVGQAPTGHQVRNYRRAPTKRLAASFVVVLVFVVGMLLPALGSVWEANLGSVDQSRTELAVYNWPDWPLQDALRRSPEIDLTAAIDHYKAALQIDPDNATANRRLGQIALAQGEYEQAEAELQAAYRTAPEQRATRQMLGECYAIRGDVASAASMWRTIDTSQDQLTIRHWWYENIGDEERAELIDRANQAVSVDSASLAGGKP